MTRKRSRAMLDLCPRVPEEAKVLIENLPENPDLLMAWAEELKISLRFMPTKKGFVLIRKVSKAVNDIGKVE